MLRRITLLLVLTSCGVAGTSGTTPADSVEDVTTMRLSSSAFEAGGTIPAVHTCDGDDVSPSLHVEGIPENARFLALVMEDPDAPRGTWDHWVAYDIPVVEDIGQGADDLGVAGVNSWGRIGYGGPCPPSGTHRYVFTVHALSGRTGLGPGATKKELLAAIASITLGQAELTGRYTR